MALNSKPESKQDYGEKSIGSPRCVTCGIDIQWQIANSYNSECNESFGELPEKQLAYQKKNETGICFKQAFAIPAGTENDLTNLNTLAAGPQSENKGEEGQDVDDASASSAPSDDDETCDENEWCSWCNSRREKGNDAEEYNT